MYQRLLYLGRFKLHRSAAASGTAISQATTTLTIVSAASQVMMSVSFYAPYHRLQPLGSVQVCVGDYSYMYRPAGVWWQHGAQHPALFCFVLVIFKTCKNFSRVYVNPASRMLNEIGRERGFPPASSVQFNTLCGPKGAFLVGSLQTVIEKMLAANEIMGGLAGVTFQLSTAMLETDRMQQSITLLGTEVAPRLRAGLNAVSTQ